MHGVTHKFVAGPPHFGSVDAAGLKTDRGGSGKTLQHLESAVAGGIRTDRSQEPRSQACSLEQAAKEIVIRMFFKQSRDLFAVFV